MQNLVESQLLELKEKSDKILNGKRIKTFTLMQQRVIKFFLDQGFYLKGIRAAELEGSINITFVNILGVNTYKSLLEISNNDHCFCEDWGSWRFAFNFDKYNNEYEKAYLNQLKDEYSFWLSQNSNYFQYDDYATNWNCGGFLYKMKEKSKELGVNYVPYMTLEQKNEADAVYQELIKD